MPKKKQEVEPAVACKARGLCGSPCHGTPTNYVTMFGPTWQFERLACCEQHTKFFSGYPDHDPKIEPIPGAYDESINEESDEAES